MTPYRVRCGKCGELLYDSCKDEYYIEMFTPEHGRCPTCGTVYSLPSILRKPDEEQLEASI
jgi:phage FluMu protein Com